MLLEPETQRLFTHALAEFAPEWEIIVELTPITTRDRDHWLCGIGTFGVTLRHRPTGAIKVLGRRSGGTPEASYHRGVSFLVLQAYAERTTDPIRRYLEGIGLARSLRPPSPICRMARQH